MRAHLLRPAPTMLLLAVVVLVQLFISGAVAPPAEADAAPTEGRVTFSPAPPPTKWVCVSAPCSTLPRLLSSCVAVTL